MDVKRSFLGVTGSVYHDEEALCNMDVLCRHTPEITLKED